MRDDRSREVGVETGFADPEHMRRAFLRCDPRCHGPVAHWQSSAST
jgi:hypothetical protein